MLQPVKQFSSVIFLFRTDDSLQIKIRNISSGLVRVKLTRIVWKKVSSYSRWTQSFKGLGNKLFS